MGVTKMTAATFGIFFAFSSCLGGKLLGEEATVLPQRWQIDTNTLVELAVNLRSARCPEQALTNIVRSEISKLYQTRIDGMRLGGAATSNDVSHVNFQVEALKKERDQLLATFKLPPPVWQLKNLSPEKQERVKEAMRLYPRVQTADDPPIEADREKTRANQKARVQYLAKYLSAEELVDYRMHHESGSTRICYLLREIHPSEEEIKKVFVQLDGQDTGGRTNGFFIAAVEEKIKAALGESRYAEYRQQLLPQNQSLNKFARLYNVPPEKMKTLKALRDGMAASTDLAAYKNAAREILGDWNAADAFFRDPFLYCPHGVRVPKPLAKPEARQLGLPSRQLRLPPEIY